jgi:hypothetical protein
MKRKQLLLLGIFLCASLIFQSCGIIGFVDGDGHVTEEQRYLDEFDRIETSGGMNVYVSKGTPGKVVVVADANLHDFIRTEVHNRVLKVYSDKIIRSAKEKKAIVTVGELFGVDASSGSNVWSQGELASKEMNLQASSGANISFDLNVAKLLADCSSGANIRISGTAAKAEMEASSGANILGEQLKASSVVMKASSGANVSSAVTDAINASASSGGNIFYFGTPTLVESKTSSGGNVIRK